MNLPRADPTYKEAHHNQNDEWARGIYCRVHKHCCRLLRTRACGSLHSRSCWSWSGGGFLLFGTGSSPVRVSWDEGSRYPGGVGFSLMPFGGLYLIKWSSKISHKYKWTKLNRLELRCESTFRGTNPPNTFDKPPSESDTCKTNPKSSHSISRSVYQWCKARIYEPVVQSETTITSVIFREMMWSRFHFAPQVHGFGFRLCTTVQKSEGGLLEWLCFSCIRPTQGLVGGVRGGFVPWKLKCAFAITSAVKSVDI